VSSLGRYAAGFGIVSGHNGCVFGLRGEVVDATQIPPLLQVPDPANGGFTSLFTARLCVILTDAQVTAHFAGAASSRLMVPPENAPPGSFPPLLFVPKAWAPYFSPGSVP
jgi:hypothetical protein